MKMTAINSNPNWKLQKM